MRSIINDFAGTLSILRDLLHLLQLFGARVSLRKDHAHLVPTLSKLLVIHFVFNGKLFKILVKLLSLLLKVFSRILMHLSQVEGISDFVLFDLKRLFWKHYFECLSPLVNG
jgi:hypothetical protein